MTSLTLLAIMLFIPLEVFAHEGHDHGGSGGGGCGGDCSAPTLGVDSSGQQKVSGGISINGEISDVILFKQDLNSKSIKTGDPVEIILKVYENRGYTELKHVELSLGKQEKLISGVWVEIHPVTIEWTKNFDGKETVMTHNKQELLKDISVQVLDNGPVIGVKFNFTPVTKFDSNTIVTKVWDMSRNSNTNYYHNALEIISDDPIDLPVQTILETKPTSKPNLEKAESSEIEKVNQEITCKVGEIQLLRSSNQNPVCVNAYQSEVLTSYNWSVLPQ